MDFLCCYYTAEEPSLAHDTALFRRIILSQKNIRVDKKLHTEQQHIKGFICTKCKPALAVSYVFKPKPTKMSHQKKSSLETVSAVRLRPPSPWAKHFFDRFGPACCTRITPGRVSSPNSSDDYLLCSHIITLPADKELQHRRVKHLLWRHFAHISCLSGHLTLHQLG